MMDIDGLSIACKARADHERAVSVAAKELADQIDSEIYLAFVGGEGEIQVDNLKRDDVYLKR